MVLVKASFWLIDVPLYMCLHGRKAKVVSILYWPSVFMTQLLPDSITLVTRFNVQDNGDTDFQDVAVGL